MPKITITLEDTAGGGLSIASDFTPTIGAPCSPAQGAALAIIARTRREWGFEPQPTSPAQNDGPMGLCRALLDPEDLGHAATAEIRLRAVQALQGFTTSTRDRGGVAA